MNDMQDLKQIISQILDIIAYQDDKNAFIEQFIETVDSEALIKLLESLSEEKREQFQKEVSDKTEAEIIQPIIKSYFSEQQIVNATNNAMGETLTDFLETMYPELDNEQKTKLDDYLKSILEPQEAPTQL